MQQWQAYSDYRAHSRQRDRRSVGWGVFWSIWWLVGSLPWIMLFWWPSPLMIPFGMLFVLLVLLSYVAAGRGWLGRRPQKVSDPPLKESPLEPFYEQGYQEQLSPTRRDIPSSSSLYPVEQWDDEQAQMHYPEQEPPMM